MELTLTDATRRPWMVPSTGQLPLEYLHTHDFQSFPLSLILNLGGILPPPTARRGPSVSPIQSPSGIVNQRRLGDSVLALGAVTLK